MQQYFTFVAFPQTLIVTKVRAKMFPTLNPDVNFYCKEMLTSSAFYFFYRKQNVLGKREIFRHTIVLEFQNEKQKALTLNRTSRQKMSNTFSNSFITG